MGSEMCIRDSYNAVLNYSKKVYEVLVKEGYRVHEDLRDELRPGEKFYYWELRGVPLRIEIGLKEVNGNYLTIFRRDTLEKFKVGYSELTDVIKKVSEEYDNNLRERAWKVFRSKIVRFDTIDEAKEHLIKNKGIVELPWCGKQECGLRMSELLEGDALGTPLDINESELMNHKCVVCGSSAISLLRLAKRY